MAIIKNIKLPNGDTHSLVDANYIHTDNNYTTTEKNKLAGVASGAEVNQNAFSNVAIGTSTISADSKTDTLTLVGGANITLTPDATNDKITILLDDTVDTGEVIATEVQAGDLVVSGASRFINTINGTASNSEKLSGQSLTSTYSSTGTAPITGAAVASAIGALDGTVSGSPSASKTLTAFSQTDGKVSATFGNISITKSQVSDFPSLGTAAEKNYTTSVSSGSVDLVTSGAVWTAIDNLPEPMVFKGSVGTGGTVTDVPVDGTAKVGDTYKVITDGTYGGKTAKIGDTLICLTKTSSANTWELIPSGDEPSGTVTSVGISNGGGLSVSGSPITSSGTITISHADTSSQATTSNSGRTYIQNITLDTYGHVTGLTSATETVTNTDRYVNSAAFAHDSTNDNVKMTLTRAGSDTATVTANIPKVSSSSAGVVPKGTTVSSQSQTTKFLREDGTWQIPSYTTNTNTTYTLGTSGNTVTLTPSNGSVQSITVPYATSAGSATDSTKLPLAGGTMTGDILFSDSGTTTRQIRGIVGANDYWRIAGGATASNSGWMEIATADDGNEPIYARQYTGAYASIKRTATLLDANGDTSFPGKIIAGMYEGYLNWGGRSLASGVTPVGMSLSAEHSANRLAYINGDLITSEFSSDSGTTWTNHDLSKASKSYFCTYFAGINIGKQVGSSEACTLDSKTRITITAQDGTNPSGRVYTNPKKLLINISSANGLEVLIEYRTGTNYLNDGAWTTFGTYTVSGWSGWNDIPLVLGSLGGDKTQTGNNWQLRLTFSVTSLHSSETYRGSCSVQGIRLFGENAWVAPSNLALSNHIYTYDALQGAIFPGEIRPYTNNSQNLGHSTYRWATVYATTFDGTATNLSGFTNTTSTATAVDSATQNGHAYVSGTSGIYGISDGACFVQAYSSSWVAQIYQDYRTGQIALRGKNNGTWQSWRKVVDSSNYTTLISTDTLLSGLPAWTANPTDDTYLIRRDTGGGASYGQVKFSTVWNYIKGKADSVYSTTDTKNTAGSTDSSSKLFLIGATSQADNPQTYSQDTAYVGTDGHLYSNSIQVVNLSGSQALTNKTYNGYTLGGACEKAVVTSIDTSASLPTSNAVKTFVEGKGYVTTDTKNTAGSTDTQSKIYLIGATSQAANPQTYSQDTAYVGTDGCVYSGGNKVEVISNNAGYHNSIYRGKSLGTSITEAQWAAISAGTFDDMYIGDYWTLSTTLGSTTSNVQYVIAGFDYWWNCGDSYPQSSNKHHVVLVPASNLYSAQMNETNVTTGGYIGSAMYTTNLANARTGISTLFGDHLYSVRRLFTNAVNASGQATGWAWATSSVDLMNENMVYGSSVWTTSGFEVGVDRTILPLFALNPASASIRAIWWLRSVATPSHFALVNGGGLANSGNASYSFGVRPAFAIY